MSGAVPAFSHAAKYFRAQVAGQFAERLRVPFNERRDYRQSFVEGTGRVGVTFRWRKRLALRSKAPRQIGQEGVGAGFGEAPSDAF